MTLNTAKRRSRARGAAMVEGVVVTVVMFVFFGMNMWAYKAYGGKIDQANSTRRDALYYASHNCAQQFSGDTDSYTDPSLRVAANAGASGEAINVGGDPQVTQAVNAGQGNGAVAPSRSGGMTTVDRQGSVNGGAVLWDPSIRRSSFTTPLHTKSFSWCNQERHDGFTGTFTGAWGAVKGIADLF